MTSVTATTRSPSPILSPRRKALSVNEFSGLRASALDKTRTEAVRPVGGRASRGGWSRGDVLASGESIAKDDSARSAVRSPRCNRA